MSRFRTSKYKNAYSYVYKKEVSSTAGLETVALMPENKLAYGIIRENYMELARAINNYL